LDGAGQRKLSLSDSVDLPERHGNDGPEAEDDADSHGATTAPLQRCEIVRADEEHRHGEHVDSCAKHEAAPLAGLQVLKTTGRRARSLG
jgi:hypothetical protein